MNGRVQTDGIQVASDPQAELDLYYAMFRFRLSAEANYDVLQNSDCTYRVRVNFKYHYFDNYNWHEGLPAGGGAPGVADFKDEWTAALHDAGLAQEYKISGYWIDAKTYTYPETWLEDPGDHIPIASKPGTR